MMMFVPEDRVTRTPLWWSSERYDYCDRILSQENTDSLFGRFLKKFSQLFA